MFEVLVCDPHDCLVENKSLGLLYTAVSRATTLGDSDAKDSAIYFIGEHMNEKRVRCIGKKKDSVDDYKRVTERREWVHFLRSKKKKCNLTSRRKKFVLHWAGTARYSFDQVSDRIEKFIYDQRLNLGFTDPLDPELKSVTGIKRNCSSNLSVPIQGKKLRVSL